MMIEMTISDFDCVRALQAVTYGKLIIQDADDEYFALEETLAGVMDPASTRILITKKYGHNRILANKQVFSETIDFLKS